MSGVNLNRFSRISEKPRNHSIFPGRSLYADEITGDISSSWKNDNIFIFNEVLKMAIK
jgi:hypothetical protein